MKFQFPELKFPNTLLTIWWGATMMAAGAAILLESQNYGGFFPQKYVILSFIGSYFLVVQAFIVRQAMRERRNPEAVSLIEKWTNVMESSYSLQLSLVIPMLCLPLILFTGSHEFPIDRNLIELLIAPGRYAGDGMYFSYLWLFAIAGSIVVYLHVRLLAAFLILLGLQFRLISIVGIMTGLVLLASSLNHLTNQVIEIPMSQFARADYFCIENGSIYYSDTTINCQAYWGYRHLNRIVESLEYSFYGLLTGGIQFANLLRSPIIYYNNTAPSLSWEFLRNLVAGILSPSLQLFFIMRYLKKRSFEKVKREFA